MRNLSIFTILLCALLAACGRPATPTVPSKSQGTSSEDTTGEELPVKPAPGMIRGRILGANPGSIWKIGVMEFRAEDPELKIRISTDPDSKGMFQIVLPPLPYEIPFAVIGFEDSNGNGDVDQGEDFVGSKSAAPGYSGRGLFLLTEAGSFVGNRSWDLAEVEFIIDVNALP